MILKKLVYIGVLVMGYAALSSAASQLTAAVQGKPLAIRRADKTDADALLATMNTKACNDSDKIVIVPEAFRSGYVTGGINARSFFVAYNHAEQLFGYKKAFCVPPAQVSDIVDGELRLNTAPAACALATLPDFTQQKMTAQELKELGAQPTTYIYTGADFTCPEARGNGVNMQLTTYALAALQKEVVGHIQKNKSGAVALVFGLTKANAGTQDDLMAGRSKSLVAPFVAFMNTVTRTLSYAQPTTVVLSRHHAFKPSFDPAATTCVPLPDDKAIPGYGCLALCTLAKT